MGAQACCAPTCTGVLRTGRRRCQMTGCNRTTAGMSSRRLASCNVALHVTHQGCCCTTGRCSGVAVVLPNIPPPDRGVVRPVWGLAWPGPWVLRLQHQCQGCVSAARLLIVGRCFCSTPRAATAVQGMLRRMGRTPATSAPVANRGSIKGFGVAPAIYMGLAACWSAVSWVVLRLQLRHTS